MSFYKCLREYDGISFLILDRMCSSPLGSSLLSPHKLRLDAMWGLLFAHSPRLLLRIWAETCSVAYSFRMECTSNIPHTLWLPQRLRGWRTGSYDVCKLKSKLQFKLNEFHQPAGVGWIRVYTWKSLWRLSALVCYLTFSSSATLYVLFCWSFVHLHRWLMDKEVDHLEIFCKHFGKKKTLISDSNFQLNFLISHCRKSSSSSIWNVVRWRYTYKLLCNMMCIALREHKKTLNRRTFWWWREIWRKKA